MSFIIKLPWPPKQLNPNARTHWRSKAVISKDYRMRCFFLTKEAMHAQQYDLPDNCTEPGSLHMVIDFYPPDRRLRDDDNAIASFKAGRDGLAKALGCDDRIFRSHPYLQIEPVKGGRVVVRITETLNL